MRQLRRNRTKYEHASLEPAVPGLQRKRQSARNSRPMLGVLWKRNGAVSLSLMDDLRESLGLELPKRYFHERPDVLCLGELLFRGLHLRVALRFARFPWK